MMPSFGFVVTKQQTHKLAPLGTEKEQKDLAGFPYLLEARSHRQHGSLINNASFPLFLSAYRSNELCDFSFAPSFRSSCCLLPLHFNTE